MSIEMLACEACGVVCAHDVGTIIIAALVAVVGGLAWRRSRSASALTTN